MNLNFKSNPITLLNEFFVIVIKDFLTKDQIIIKI